jgi:hypothetical protein
MVLPNDTCLESALTSINITRTPFFPPGSYHWVFYVDLVEIESPHKAQKAQNKIVFPAKRAKGSSPGHRYERSGLSPAKMAHEENGDGDANQHADDHLPRRMSEQFL